MTKKTTDTVKVKKAVLEAEQKPYVLRLFVTGILPNSARAVINIKAICEKYLKDRYDLEIIDIYQQPNLALKEEILQLSSNTLFKDFKDFNKKIYYDIHL